MALIKNQILISVAFLLIGCASAPQNDPWNDIEVQTESATRPLNLPQWPLPTEVTDEVAVFDLDGVRALEAYRVAGEANTEIALEHSEQIDELRTATKYLVDAGKAQRKVAEIRLTILEEERRHWMYEKAAYIGGFLLIALAVAL